MNEVLIKVEGVSKKFCRGLKKSLWYGIQDISAELMGKHCGGKSELRDDEFWALKDISFELRRGECLGLIGPNGAGKSTLLKLLSGILKPDAGCITTYGQVGSLIELGAGFNPILSGRENIFVNASVLGISKAETKNKLDEIIAFSEIEEFIDTPVSRYSSGMRVRLGFAVATAFKPDILLLDEVLAVGDASFRTKALNRTRELIKDAAVIFVSHAMPQISRICTQAIVMQKGHANWHADPQSAIKEYLQDIGKYAEEEAWSSGQNSITEVKINGTDNNLSKNNVPLIDCNEPFFINLLVSLDSDVEQIEIVINYIDLEENIVALSKSNFDLLSKRKVNIQVKHEKMFLFPGKFNVNVTVSEAGSDKILARKWSCCPFEVSGDLQGGRYPRIEGEWNLEHV